MTLIIIGIATVCIPLGRACSLLNGLQLLVGIQGDGYRTNV